MKTTSLIALAGLLVCGLSTAAAAQERSAAGSYERHLSLNYSFLHDDGHSGTMGVMVDFGKQMKGNLSVVGEFAVNHFSGAGETYTTVGGGIRYGSMARSKKVRPFLQLVAGPQQSFGSTGFNIQPGFGLDMKISRNMDTKLQFDFPIVQWEGDTYKQFRFNIGVGLPLGKR